ncbi:MAG TPA: SMP-30/gluconolactonase/LRE family protein [Ideonella sp.]|nr:SMP-30/gluconolactonase/LRE family protein [Ideonella sp.]
MDIVCNLPDQVGESPVWSVAEQALWWVDIEGRRLHRFGWATRAMASWPTAEMTGCIALHAQGGLLAAMETGVFHVQPQADGTLAAKRLAGVAHAQGNMRFNDGRTDRAGRFWAGSMVRDMSLAAPAGALYRFTGAGLSAPVIEGLITPNGLGFSPDNRTMYLSDSHPGVQRVWAFDLGEDGEPGNRREFIDMNAYPGRPDGAAVDTDGAYWICANDAGLVHRFTPDGRLDRSIEVPVSKPAMCAFGGPDLQTLFVTSIRPASPPPGQEHLAGALFATRPGAQGLPESPFKP